ncbi:metallo-phosphoesterase [Bordetella ansorpii]|uniref:Metallo-phosphoesterase n=1 Tax=Bordetella ansorpii TaxID=288768 RepID=A0A157S572_9BORD|nr:metallophosphoesterase [Bordetella ansorpii]SAI65441.1 metallo-phosphoesterase [Bordetella ansorpii]
MKIQLLSDLHLETNADFMPMAAADADLLILAGDIGTCRPDGRPFPEGFGLRQFSPKDRWPVPVVYLPGNHEYDHQDFDAAHDRLRNLCESLGIQWLERESLVIDGVRLLGTTLWADFDALVQARDTQDQVRIKREKAFRAANFYLEKAGTTRGGQPFLADALKEQALVCQAWLKTALDTDFDGPTVAVTHFAPTLSSADPRYGLTPGTAGFCNSLDALLPKADLWIHGHLHCAFDYVQQGCRVVANPLGYEWKGEQDGFNPTLVLDIETRRPGW